MMLLLMKYSSRTSHTLISLANGTSRTLMNPPFVNGRYIDQWELPLMNGRLPLVNGSYWRTGGTTSKSHPQPVFRDEICSLVPLSLPAFLFAVAILGRVSRARSLPCNMCSDGQAARRRIRKHQCAAQSL
jgi:hypothetical protein